MMFRKLALSGAALLALVIVAWAATVPVVVHKNAAGIDEDSLGVVLIDKDTGDPYNASAAGGGSSITSPVGAGTSAAAVRVTEASDSPTLSRLPAALGSGGGLKVDGSGTALPVVQAPGTSGGATTYSLIAAASTNSTLISAGVHQVYGVQVFNNSSTIAYFKIYDKATAPTCNSDTPVQRYMVPGNSGGSGFIVPVVVGFPVALGLGFCLTGGIADNDNTSVAATAYLVNILYK